MIIHRNTNRSIFYSVFSCAEVADLKNNSSSTFKTKCMETYIPRVCVMSPFNPFRKKKLIRSVHTDASTSTDIPVEKIDKETQTDISDIRVEKMHKEIQTNTELSSFQKLVNRISTIDERWKNDHPTNTPTGHLRIKRDALVTQRKSKVEEYTQGIRQSIPERWLASVVKDEIRTTSKKTFLELCKDEKKKEQFYGFNTEDVTKIAYVPITHLVSKLKAQVPTTDITHPAVENWLDQNLQTAIKATPCIFNSFKPDGDVIVYNPGPHEASHFSTYFIDYIYTQRVLDKISMQYQKKIKSRFQEDYSQEQIAHVCSVIYLQKPPTSVISIQSILDQLPSTFLIWDDILKKRVEVTVTEIAYRQGKIRWINYSGQANFLEPLLLNSIQIESIPNIRNLRREHKIKIGSPEATKFLENLGLNVHDARQVELLMADPLNNRIFKELRNSIVEPIFLAKQNYSSGIDDRVQKLDKIGESVEKARKRPETLVEPKRAGRLCKDHILQMTTTRFNDFGADPWYFLCRFFLKCTLYFLINSVWNHRFPNWESAWLHINDYSSNYYRNKRKTFLKKIMKSFVKMSIVRSFLVWISII